MEDHQHLVDRAAKPVVVGGPGWSLVDAAAWVGHACWAELRWHQLLTTWLADEPDAEAAVAWWSLRADAAERAEAWHRRLPELRELPRPELVGVSGPEVATALQGAAATAPAERLGVAGAVLDALATGYQSHHLVAVGPADAPVARTCADAVTSIERSRDRLRRRDGGDGAKPTPFTVELP